MEKTKMFTLAGRIVGNLFKKPATTKYPFEPVEFPERMRGHVVINIDDCITCGLCARACPSLAIQVDRKAGTWTHQPVRLRAVRKLRACLSEEMPDHGERLHGTGHHEEERHSRETAGREG